MDCSRVAWFGLDDSAVLALEYFCFLNPEDRLNEGFLSWISLSLKVIFLRRRGSIGGRDVE
jgi:hypothetical protein